MGHETLKPATIRLPVLLYRAEGRGTPWQAWFDTGDSTLRERLDVSGRTEAATRQALTDLTITALRRAVRRPVLVIGGGPGYAACVHVINPQPHG